MSVSEDLLTSKPPDFVNEKNGQQVELTTGEKKRNYADDGRAPLSTATAPRSPGCFALAEKPPLNYRYAGTLRDHWTEIRALSSTSKTIRISAGIRNKNAAKELGSVTLTATPPLLRDGEDLVVSFSGVKRPHQTDFVGISCGPKAHDKDFLVKIGITEANGPGADGPELPNFIRFSSLYMMRCNYTVEYFNFQSKGNVFAPLAKLEVGMNVDEMSVMFNSASRETPVVKYGLDPATLNKHTEGKSKTYTDAHLCNRPANLTSQQWFRDPGNMHTVILKELKLGTRYFYKFDESVKSAKFIAYADMGVDPAPAATSTAVRSYQDVMDGYDSFLLHFGDISYARGHAHMWDEFFHVIEPYATRVPYMVSIGNHEYDYVTGGANDPSGATGEDGRMDFHPDWANYGEDSSGECSVPMFYRWDALPTATVSIGTPSTTQYKWLENDLKNVDRKKTPWVVLTSHRMMYTTQLGEEADYKVAQHFRDEVEDLLWTHKVNLMLVGHQHSYERSCAVRNGKCTEDGKGPVHIVIGSAGAGLEKQGFSNKLGEWSVSHLNDWGYLRIDSTEDSMSVQFILNRNGVVYDEVTLTPWN
ncbi:Metallo-dependent phosphatase-like [Phytophthora cactorum]|nr:Metallo-dependent phosphatase-like [Phytophthora cactorum]